MINPPVWWIYLGTNSASPSPLPSGLSTGKVKRFRNVSVTNIHVSLLSYNASEGVTSLIPSKKRWNKKIHKLELFAEWIFALCTCGNLKTSHQSNCTYEWIIWRQYSEIENCVTETRFSETEPCYWNESFWPHISWTAFTVLCVQTVPLNDRIS